MPEISEIMLVRVKAETPKMTRASTAQIFMRKLINNILVEDLVIIDRFRLVNSLVLTLRLFTLAQYQYLFTLALDWGWVEN